VRASFWGQLLYPPNLLSLARVALAPVAASSILDFDYQQALGVCVLAGFTDALDGMLARNFGWATPLGQILDPLADKILMAAVFLSLGAAGQLPWWLVGLVFGRDLLILVFSGAAIHFLGHREFRPSVWGKISTAVQVVTALAAIAKGVTSKSVAREAVSVLVWLAAAATLWSGLHYAWLGRQVLGLPRTQTPRRED